MSKVKILLLTNRDSDNVGDQIIEASVISLLRGAMKNLGFDGEDFSINTRAAGIISKRYMATEDEALLQDARQAISSADVVVFGGAPLFNYSYQNFYKRTIKTLELAQEYGVPVLFSSIGVEPYSAENPKSQALKAALQMPCVRQITTRDDLASVLQYLEGTDTPAAHVADPAVYADIVLGEGKPPARPEGSTQRTIGLIVTRAGIFKDNGIEFDEAAQRTFWLDVIAQLEERGDDYRLFTTGHFSDEVFLDSLIRSHGVPAKKAAITVNSPEELVNQLTACDGVIAYRLHASITAFAYGIPSIGLSWNFKVPYFYESVGYGERALPAERWTAPEVIAALDTALDEGVVKDEAFLYSVYETLFSGLRGIFAPESEQAPYTHEQLATELPAYKKVTFGQYQGKVQRKLRRTYENYQRYYRYHVVNEPKREQQKEKIAELTEQLASVQEQLRLQSAKLERAQTSALPERGLAFVRSVPRRGLRKARRILRGQR